MGFIQSNTGLIYALLASMLWGLNYVLFEKVMNKVNILSIMFIDYLFCSVIIGIFYFIFGNYKNDLTSLGEIKWILLANVLVHALAGIFIALSIKNSNAVIAGLIEISYPLFILIFSYFLLNQNSFEWKTILGGILILSGVIIISLK